MTEEKVNLIDQYYFAMFKPSFYHKLSKVKVGIVIIYTIILMAFITIIQYVMPVTAWIIQHDGFSNIILDKVPEFTLKDGNLTMEEPFSMTVGGMLIEVDTSVDEYKLEDLTKKQKISSLLIGKKGMFFVSGNSIMPTKWTETNLQYLDNKTLNDQIPVIYFTIIIMGIVYFVTRSARYLIIGFIYAWLGYRFSKTIDTELKYWKVYQLTIYAQTIGLVATTVAMVLGGATIGFFISLGAVLATIFILNAGIMSHKISNSISGN